MEGRPAETNANVDNSAPPSVAQLAGRFREQAAVAKETPASKPARRRPPCSLPLFPPKVELGQNGEEKSPPNASHHPKIKVKSSPLIEKLQVRTRGSIKRRPPSRKFRRSQSDCGDLGNFRAAESSQENGAKEENEDEVFTPKSKAPGPPPSSDGAVEKEMSRSMGSEEKPPLRRTSSMIETREEKGRAAEEAKHGEKAAEHSADKEPQSPAQGEAAEPETSSPKAENGPGTPTEETMAGEEVETEKSAEVKEERAENEEDKPGQKSQDTEKQEESAIGEEAPTNPPGKMEGGSTSEQEKDEEKQEVEGGVLETGCHPETGPAQLETRDEALSRGAVPTAEDNTPLWDAKM
ncbi:capZ-interacting protein isoform X1 [Loxodonta africana]|uniref:capZ-interacting protein isoform X1 n=1 Tax=Loxodonta africana TaxID=9785 RepID=UPI0030D576C1